MGYENPLLDYVDRNPIAGFFIAPIVVYYGGNFVAGMIRKGKTGSFFSGIFGDKEDQSPMAGIGQIRTEGGDASDLMFRATISSRPTGPGLTAHEEVQAQPTGAPVRYDREYHDSVFLPNLDYQDNKQVVTQSYPSKVTDTYVFAGINGLGKINMR